MRIKGTHTYIGADNQQEVQKEDIELDVLGFNNINVTGKNTDEFNVSVYFNNAEDVVSTGDELDNYKFNSATAFYNGYANGPDHIREINIRLEDTDNYYNRNIITTTISTMNGATEEFVNQMWEELNEVVEVETGYDIDTILGTEKEKADQRRAQAEEDELKIDGEYPPEVIERAQKIFDTCKLEGADIHIDKDGVSVLVRDTVNNIGFWFDIYPSKEGDLEGDWNQYIFNNTITEDLVREALQENGRFFEAVFEVAEDYAMEKDAIKWNDETNKYEFKTESKKVNKKENKKGISRYLKEDFYDGDGGYDEADWEEEAMGEEREPVEEYTILFEDGSEIGEQYHGEFITEDKDEADDLFNELKEEHKLDQVFEYFRKVWEWDRVNEEYYETDVEVYFRAGDEIELYDESKKTESNTEEYWDGTEIARDGFMSLMKFNFGVDSKGNNYIVTVDANDVKRFRADNDKEAVEIYNQFKEEYNNTDHADLTMNIKSIAPREESKKTEGYSLGDDKESFDVYKHTAEFLNKVGKALEDLGWKFNKEKGKFEKEDITIDMEAIQDNVNDLYIGSNKLKLSKFADDFSGYEDIGEDTGIIYYVSAKADDYEARQLANKIDRCDVITESRKTEAKPEEADKEIWGKVEHIVDAADNELGPDQSNEYQYDEHIKFVIYRDFEYEDIFAVYTYVDEEVQEDLDTGDVHLEDLDATIVDMVKKLQSKEVKTESRYIVYDYADGDTMQDEEEKGLEPSQFTIYDNKADDFYYDELGNNPVFDKEEDAEQYIRDNKLNEALTNTDKVIVYQIDNTENCDYAFMDYTFAKEKGIDLKDYKKTAEVQVNTDLDGDVNSVLELVFGYGNTNQEYYQENPEARSISVSDILEYNGKKYYVDSFGFEEVVGTQEDNKEKNLTETKYGDSNLDKIVPDAYCEIEKTENGYKLNCGIGDHTNLGSGNFTIYPENYIADLYEEVKSLAKEKKNKGEIKRVKDNIKDLVPMYNELIPEYNQLIEEMIKDLTPFAEKSKQGQLTRADLDNIEEITGRVSPNRMSTLPEFNWDGKFGKLISFIGNLKRWRNDLADPLARADTITITESKEVKTESKEDTKYIVCSYYDEKLHGLEDDLYTNEWDDVEEFAHRKLMQGNMIEIENTKTGKSKRINPDEYNKEFDGEFIVRQEELDEDKKITEAEDLKAKADAVKEKVEKAKADIGLKQAEEMVDTENELTDGIKKEIIQYAKQQGLDVEKLQKQGVLDTVGDTLDSLIGDMVSKSAVEFMDNTGKTIEWDFEVKDNNINVIWNEVE